MQVDLKQNETDSFGFRHLSNKCISMPKINYVSMIMQAYVSNEHNQTSEETKCVASPAATNSFPFNRAPVSAKCSPVYT